MHVVFEFKFVLNKLSKLYDVIKTSCKYLSILSNCPQI